MPIRTVIEPLSIIVGIDEHGGFGKDGKIPWVRGPHGKADLKHFKDTTKGGVCIMGRNTYDDMLKMNRAKKSKNILPGRESYVITSRGGETPGAEKALSIREVINNLQEDDKREIFILGGYRLFIEALPCTLKIYMTIVPGDFKCDVYFPINKLDKFKIVDAKTQGKLKFITYQRGDVSQWQKPFVRVLNRGPRR